VLICPQCHAEYREGFTSCSDCHVLLVRKLPLEPEVVPEPGDPNADPFCSFWKGNDARVHAELCFVLDEARIPHKTVRRQDHLFNLSNYPAFQIGVPFSLYESAENAVREAFQLDPEDPEAVQNLVAPPLLPDSSDRVRKLPEVLLPAPDEDIPGPPLDDEASTLSLEEHSVEIWSGTDASCWDMFVASLHENEIPCRWEVRNGHYSLRVLPADAQRAREVLAEIINAAPPSQ